MDKVRATRLDNGVRVVTSAVDGVESVSLGVWAGIGARYETDRLAGISHFIEHLLFKGTGRRSAREITRAIEGRGGYLNAFTQEESTCYYSRVAFNHAWRALDVLIDMYLHPALASGDIDRERGVIVEEIMMYRDQPQHAVQDKLGGALWCGHPLGRPIIGGPESLRNMRRAEIVDFKRRMYVPGNTVVSGAGRIDHADCVARVREALSPMRPLRRPRFRAFADSVRQQAVAWEARDIEQAHLAMGFRCFGRLDDRRYALRILNAVLGENMSSRLFQVVRERHGLAYSIHSSAHLFQDSGALVISAGLDRARLRKALRLIVREARSMKERRVGQKELRRAKDYVVGQMRLSLESTSSQMLWLGDNLLTHGRFVPPEESIDRLQAVTAEDVCRVAAGVLRRRRTSLALIAPGLSDADTAWLGAELAAV